MQLMAFYGRVATSQAFDEDRMACISDTSNSREHVASSRRFILDQMDVTQR